MNVVCREPGLRGFGLVRDGQAVFQNGQGHEMRRKVILTVLAGAIEGWPRAAEPGRRCRDVWRLNIAPARVRRRTVTVGTMVIIRGCRGCRIQEWGGGDEGVSGQQRHA